jgi:DNA helicase-2/ATP-dependent DNA helicase PcrA
MRELTAEQRRAITTLDRPVSLVAAAGSGKTTVLVHRYLECLRRGATPSQILAVTFTQDAARQLKTRIAATLRGDGESPEREARAKEIEGSSGIGTLHGLCHQILNQFGSLVGLPPAERILDTFEQAEVFETAYREWLESLSPEELGEWLSLYPRQALRELCAQLYSQLHTLTRSLSHPPSEPASVHRLVAAAASGWLRRCQEAQNHLGRYSFDDLEHLALRILREEPAVASRLRERFRFAMVDEFQDTSRLQWDILRRILGDSP